MLLTGQGTAAETLAETTIMKVLIVLWAGYAVGVGAHGLWDFDERAIGFYSAFVAVVSVVALIYFAVELQNRYPDDVSIAMSAGTLLLSILAGTLFFYLAIPFNVLRLVAAWFMLVGSMAVAAVGLLILTTVIEVV